MAGHLSLLVNLAPERSLPNRYFSIPLVVFYTTVAPEPFLVVYFSVALFRESPRADVIRRSALRCPDFPHIAKAITNAGGTSNVMEAYSKYIHRASPVYVERKTVSPFDAVEVIYDSGGIPVIAHPYDIDIAEKLIKDLML